MAISYHRRDAPKYDELRSAVDAYYAALLPPLERLRAAVFRSLLIPDPAKAAEEPFRYTQVTRQTIDQAAEIFLAEVAGPDRTRKGFSGQGPGPVGADGVIQEQEVELYTTGLHQGAALMDSRPTLRSDRQSPSIQKMLDSAFDRLSENGKLRLEGVRDEIHEVLVGAQDAGISPLETARQLAGQFDEYSSYEFERLARTEAAYASEAGVRDQLADLGIDRVEWLISADACPVCEDLAAGGPYDIDDEDNLPPAHPNCLCSVNPVTANEQQAEDA